MNTARQILNADEISRILNRMAHALLEGRRGAESLALVGIHSRGVFLSRRLAGIIAAGGGASPPLGEMDISLYRDDWTRIGEASRIRDTRIPFAVEGRRIVLVDDVLFTGRTIRAALDALIDFGRPARIELAVLIDRGHRELPIQADYTGRSVETRKSETVNVRLAESDGTDDVLISCGSTA
ncbi:MAG: bifunctional pyr operon transcriptional regulator/uracil phosphoribosyltransferase [Desulfobacterales bacterium]|nr:MAG: bifunctional pyr operon transcriptional regulator/uracil phosphoribosyltransferase [Desulfobacterales bacterium]